MEHRRMHDGSSAPVAEEVAGCEGDAARLVGSDRVLAVLKELAWYPDGVGLEELTRVIGSPKPTVHRALGAAAETFDPAGPWLATTDEDEIDDVLALDMWLDVDGARRQNANTRTMVFDPYFIVHHLSQFLALEPGDLINTGTPPGVGMGFTPPVRLRPGDAMEFGVARLGSQRRHVPGPR
ncbi:fumarylacetoacetate hydrolase family protein [Streptomyces sp. ADMS]|uniref:fumarylacetoacetate hydrolase family protein n=1 Tax=Streptomyces sp. ADMS TaxID=3071415 RepID=UPI00296F5502|nr:fumarylacetoacetate hydrolase family protein [Streptomyces sp. ADMS]MDW4910449.1 fumarylacetoacetate hydrolase family protein [Streptomyces sp. ADMS]